MQVNLYKRMHGEEEELAVSGEIHPANLGFWIGNLFEFDSDIRIEILGDGNEKEWEDPENEDGQPVLEEDVKRTVH